MTPAHRAKRLTPAQRCREIAKVIEHVEHRCMAADGPVTNTRFEMTDDEMRRIYRLAKGATR